MADKLWTTAWTELADDAMVDADKIDDSSSTNKFATAAQLSKLDGIEASADVTDTANVTAAGALMDSEVANLAAVKAFDPTDYATAAQGTTADSALQPGDIGSTVQAHSAVLDSTTASFTTADETKLDGIEAGADVTDATNVDAAGAVMNSDTSTAAMSFVVDEDDMTSNSATKVPTQQSVKAYVDANAGGGTPEAPVVVSGTTDTLAAADNGKFNIYTNASAVTVTIPTDAADDLADGFECTLYSAGAGGLSLSTTGVTLLGDTPPTAINQDEVLFVKKTETANTWIVTGGGINISDVLALLQTVDGDSSGLDADLLDGVQGSGYQTALSGAAISTVTPANDDKILIQDASDSDNLKVVLKSALAGGVDTSGTPEADDVAVFTDADTIQGRSYAEFKADLDLEVGVDIQPYDVDTLKADTADTLTAGFDSSDFAAGTKSSGTYTPDPADGNFQVATNGGAHTLAPPATSCAIVIHYTNNGSAGTITTSGFTAVTGDSFTTTDTHEFVCVITKINDVSVLNVTALQ